MQSSLGGGGGKGDAKRQNIRLRRKLYCEIFSNFEVRAATKCDQYFEREGHRSKIINVVLKGIGAI